MSMATSTVELTDQQKDVLSRLAEGKKIEEIAKELDIQKVNVRSIKDRLFMKFGAATTEDLVKKAVEHGYIS